MNELRFKERERSLQWQSRGKFQEHEDICKGIQLKLKLDELIQLSRKYNCFKASAQEQQNLSEEAWTKLRRRSKAMEQAWQILQKHLQQEKVIVQAERLREEFERDWTICQRASSMKNIEERNKLRKICLGGYDFQKQEDGLPLEKYFSYYLLLSTLEPFAGKENIMPLLSKQIKNLTNKKAEICIDDMVRADAKPDPQRILCYSEEVNRPPKTSNRRLRKKPRTTQFTNRINYTFSRQTLRSAQYTDRLRAIFSDDESERPASRTPERAQQGSQNLTPEAFFFFDLQTLQSLISDKATKRKTVVHRHTLNPLTKPDEEMAKVFRQKRNLHWNLNMANLRRIKMRFQEFKAQRKKGE